MRNQLVMVLIVTLLSACAVGPDYKRAPVVVPVKYKEAAKGWKVAQPNDLYQRGPWWEMFHDEDLNALERKLNISNQNIASAVAQYQQACALVDEARAGFFPTLGAALSLTRQKQASSSSRSSSFVSTDSISGTTTINRSSGPFNTQSLVLTATWEPDIWGSLRRTVEASNAGAQASAAQLALARLSAQASLAQFYFELRGVDLAQDILNRTVIEYKKSLKIVRNQYASGTVARADVVQAQVQLETAESQAINNGINRALYEHAIAVLIGEPPALFKLAYHPQYVTPPIIPVEIPTVLLERRPDIAQAERLMAQANAQIGIAIAAFFPVLTLNGTGSSIGAGSIGNWLSMPAYGWSLGPQLAATFLDGGLRRATVAAAKANYHATVAGYRQIVLAAFQDVEDNLASIRILKAKARVDNQVVADARLAAKLVMNQYLAGTVPYSSVITAQTSLYTAERTAADVSYLRMTSAVGLIKALGGCWSGCNGSPPFLSFPRKGGRDS